MEENTLKVVQEFNNDGMLKSDFSTWDRAKEVTVSWVCLVELMGIEMSYAALILQFAGR